MSKRIVGITGPRGFVAGHLIRRLQHNERFAVELCSRETMEDSAALAAFVDRCDTVVHLAAMNRGDAEEILATNTKLVDRLLTACRSSSTPTHLVFSSSTQSELGNPYGRSKKYGEEQFAQWANASDTAAASILIIPNVFGPGCKPFYNSVVATFCYQLAQGEEPKIHQDSQVEFIWINDLVDEICEAIDHPPQGALRVRLNGSAKIKVSELLAKLEHFRESGNQNLVPNLTDPLDASLYATYLSYLSLESHCHRPQVHRDERGQLFEIIRLATGGQVFFSTTKPGVIRGNHYHTRKIEWFCVLKGEAAIRLRQVESNEVHEFRVSGEFPQFVSIPVLHTHQIENVGDEELLTMFWCNEIFSPEDADTYFEKVA